jgi:integrase
MARKGRLDRGLYQRPNAQGKLEWHVRLVHNGKEYRTGAFPTKTKAREYYENAKTQQRDDKFFPDRQKDHPLATDYIETYVDKLNVSGKGAKTQYEERRYAKWWKARLGGKRLKDITLTDLEDVKGELTGKGYAAETIKHHLKFLRQVLKKAVGERLLRESPFAHHEFTMPKVSQAMARFLTVEEETELLDALGHPYAQWARLAIVTGLRKTELFSLRWSNIDLSMGLPSCPKQNRGKYSMPS